MTILMPFYNAPLHHRVRGYCHGSTPLLLSAHRLGTPVAVCHVVSDVAKPQWASRTEARYAQHEHSLKAGHSMASIT